MTMPTKLKRTRTRRLLMCPKCGRALCYCNCPEPEATGSGASSEYSRGVSDACALLEAEIMTEAEQRDGIAWSADCPQNFAWSIRQKLLPPNK